MSSLNFWEASFFISCVTWRHAFLVIWSSVWTSRSMTCSSETPASASRIWRKECGVNLGFRPAILSSLAIQDALNDLKDQEYSDRTREGINRTGSMIFRKALELNLIKRSYWICLCKKRKENHRTIRGRRSS